MQTYRPAAKPKAAVNRAFSVTFRSAQNVFRAPISVRIALSYMPRAGASPLKSFAGRKSVSQPVKMAS